MHPQVGPPAGGCKCCPAGGLRDPKMGTLKKIATRLSTIFKKMLKTICYGGRIVPVIKRLNR